MSKVTASFIDGTNQVFENVVDMDVNETDYVIHFAHGPLTFIPKRNVFTVTFYESVDLVKGVEA